MRQRSDDVPHHPVDASADRDLPPLLVLTDRRACASRGRSLVETVECAVDAGARAVVFREKDLPRTGRLDMAHQLRDVVPLLIVASDVSLAREASADGVHLATQERPPGDTASIGAGGGGADDGLLFGRSCHSRAEVECSAREGALYATLSPIFPSASKPGYGPALGVGPLGGHPIPVYALGGIEPGRARQCLAAGATGVAVMGAVMGAADPARVVSALLDDIADVNRDTAHALEEGAREKAPGTEDDRRAPTGRFGHAGTLRLGREDAREDARENAREEAP